MKFPGKCWALAVRLLDIITFSSLKNQVNQQPLGDISRVHHPHFRPPPVEVSHAGGPVFSPPNGPDDFFCEYPKMPDYRKCSTSSDRGCWLSKTDGSGGFDIRTDYEKLTPTGITRRYTLNVSDMVLAPDGFRNTGGKAFNNSYPGPWIKACWGDDIEITVTKYLKHNGTTIHWHGIRQLGTMDADGVNGVTQCPIAGYPTNDSYTYKFKASQYGTTWYHGHYALQYSDGVLGPMTIFGPSSANYDDHKEPILMTDWVHQSAFSLFYQEVVPGFGPPSMTSILLNGTGHYSCTADEKKNGLCFDQTSYYNTTVTRGKKYLLRLINTSVDTTFSFSIDNHVMTVISSDFVPLVPYTTDAVLVGIGQRYHVVVEMKPDDQRPPGKQAYWIRTTVAAGCGRFKPATPANNTGILYYEGTDTKVLPDTKPKTLVAPLCADEPDDKLKPIVPWTVGKPSNQQQPSTFEAGIENPPAPGPLPPPGQFSRWSLGKQPLWLDFSNPTILNVNKLRTAEDWPPQYVVVPQSVTTGSWIYLVITTNAFPFGPNPNKNFVPASHPIHLHGHDFAILKQSRSPYWEGDLWNNITVNNPPRRDVALLPGGGYLLIAFKADSPGAWLMHCHIAWHASAGLAVQILESDPARAGQPTIPTGDMADTRRVCVNWKQWVADWKHWDDPNADDYQDDSGI